MEAKKKRKERTRNFVLKFKEPLSNNILSDLSKDRKFYTKYRVLKPIKIGEEVVGLIIEDSFNINYSIGLDSIIARSLNQSDDPVIKKLKLMGDRIIELFNLGKDSYEIIEGDDFRYLENSLLDSWFKDAEFIKKIKNEFEGEGGIQLIQVKFVIRNPDGDKLISLGYEDAEKLVEKRLLIEADKEYLPRILKATGNNG